MLVDTVEIGEEYRTGALSLIGGAAIAVVFALEGADKATGVRMLAAAVLLGVLRLGVVVRGFHFDVTRGRDGAGAA